MPKIEKLDSRAYLLYHRTKLLCRTCNQVHPVVDYKPMARHAVLSCGHERSVNDWQPVMHKEREYTVEVEEAA
jgi:hypothetical protein